MTPTLISLPRESKVRQSSASYWDSMVTDFDAIYSGNTRSGLGKLLDRWLRKDIYDRVHETVRLISKLGPAQSVLDVGTGTGRLCIPLARQGHTIVGVDFSQNMLDQATRLTHQAGVASACRFIEGDLVQETPAALQEYTHFDAIAILGVLDYISDPFPMFQRLVAYTPKRIIASFPRESTLRSYIRRLRYWMQGLDCPLYFYTPQQVRNIGKGLGARHTHLEVMGELHFAVYEF